MMLKQKMSADSPMLNIESAETVRKTWREIYGR